MSDFEKVITAPICIRIITVFLKNLEKTPMNIRNRPPSLRIDGKNEYFNELRSPSFIGGEVVAEEDLKACEALDVIKIKYKDNNTFSPLGYRKASVEFNPLFEERCRKALNLELSNATEEWNNAINQSQLSHSIKEVLKKGTPIKIEGKTPSEIVQRIDAYYKKERSGDFVRMASASMFWGLSKALDNRPDIWHCLNILPAPITLNAWGFDNASKKILFIENKQTFEAAQLKPEIFGEFILVYSSGYAGTGIRLNNSLGRSIYFSTKSKRVDEHTDTLENCLDGNTSIKTFFWGDLDYEGINIFLSLKKLIPSTSLWDKGYSAMLSSLKDKGHTPTQSKKEGQADPGETGIMHIDNILLPLIRRNGFFDQEGILF